LPGIGCLGEGLEGEQTVPLTVLVPSFQPGEGGLRVAEIAVGKRIEREISPAAA
jgi:hypothetical protein